MKTLITCLTLHIFPEYLKWHYKKNMIQSKYVLDKQKFNMWDIYPTKSFKISRFCYCLSCILLIKIRQGFLSTIESTDIDHHHTVTP